MREALISPDYFGAYLVGPTWANWRVMLLAIMGEPLDDAELVIFQSLTDRVATPVEPVREFWGIVGRRGGKTRAMSVLAAFIGGCCDHREVLAPGERGQLPVLAASTRQAQSIYGMIRGVFDAVPRLRGLIESETADTLRLTSLVDITVRPASFRTIRSITAVSAIGDEIAFWRDAETSANPDAEVIGALRPALLTAGGMFVGISSPYARRGELYTNFSKHFGPNGNRRRLVMRAPSLTMNSSLPAEEIAEAYRDDPARAAAEYGAEFRADIEAFVSREVVERLVDDQVVERMPVSGVTYRAFVDMSGGSHDSAAIAIAHHQGSRAVLDAVRERKAPHSPEAVVAEFAELAKRYGLRTVRGDAYAGLFPREAFQRHGIVYTPADRTKSQLYVDLLPRLNSGDVALLDIQVLVDQLCALERRVSRGGRDTIDHPPNGRDDVANAVAGVLSEGARASTGALVGYYTLTGGQHGPTPYNQATPGWRPEPDWIKRGFRFPPTDHRRWTLFEEEIRRAREENPLMPGLDRFERQLLQYKEEKQ